MNRLTALITSVLVVVATLLSVVCSHAIDAPAKAGAGQRLKAIIEDNYHPYSFINEHGQPDGFSVEIARAVAKAMDLELEMRAGKWDFALKELETGQIDLIPIIAYSPEREKIFNFSVPYTVVYDAIFFRKGTTGIRSLKDLSGKTVIVTNNDLAHDYLLSSGLSKTMNIVLVKSGPDALKQLAAEKGDAAIMPKLIGMVTAKKLNLVDIETSPQLIESYTRSWGFAVKAGNLALLERLNQGLNIIKSSGEYDAIYKKWFGALEGTHFNLKMLLPYGSGALLIFLGIITWNVILKRQVKAKTDNLVEEIDQRKQAEELLQESQRLRVQAEELGRVGGWEFNIDTRLLTWTKMVYDIHELDIIGQQSVDQSVNFYTPASRPIIERAMQRAIEQGEPFDLELEIITAKGNLRSVNAIGKADLRRRRVYGFIQDITERKQTEKVLRESELWMNGIFNALEESVLVVTPDRRLRNINHVTQKIFGYSREELLNQSTEILHVDNEHYIEFGSRIQDAFDKGEAANFEFEARKKSGEIFPTEHTVSLLKSEKGETKGIVSVVRDITERKQTEEAQLQSSRAALNMMRDAIAARDRAVLLSQALRASEESYRILFREMQNGFAHSEIICDSQGRPINSRYLAVNPAFERITGRKVEDVVGKTILEVFPALEPGWLETFGRVALTGEPAHFEMSATELGVTFDVSAFRPAPNQYACTFSDITERKRAEEKITEQLQELQRFNDVTIGREWNMIELKKEVNALLKQTGQEEKYPIVE
jgi:PAS domain S-box-containing protein